MTMKKNSGITVREFLKSISGKSQQANALPRSRRSASSFIRGTSGADNRVDLFHSYLQGTKKAPGLYVPSKRGED